MNKGQDRRSFLKSTGVLLSSGIAATAVQAQAPEGFALAKLPYAFDALEPHIDARTVEIHWDKHHRAYVTNLNKLLADHKDLLKLDINSLIQGIKSVPEAIRQGVTNNAGGHANHNLYWNIMGPKAGGTPSGALAKAIDQAFESFDKFKEKVIQAGMTRFGSGWSWLVVDEKKKLQVISSANQDNPLMMNLKPVLGVDVWEHAYYLKYQNRRADYLAAWWNLVNWKEVDAQYGAALKK